MRLTTTKRISNLLTLLIWVILLDKAIFTPLSAQQDIQKIGGICFRVDDDQPINYLTKFAKVFDRYGYHFTFCLNLALVDTVDQYFQMINDLQASGHEFADHSPNHTTFSFTTFDTIAYTGREGVDHISGNRVCLAYQALNISHINSGGATIDIKNGVALSKVAGDFKNFSLLGVSLMGIYLPATGELFSVGWVKADNPNRY